MNCCEFRAMLQKIAAKREELQITPQQLADLGHVIDSNFPAPAWVSVADRLPPYGKPVLVARQSNDGSCIVEQGRRTAGDWWQVYGSRVKRVSHWMPLPAPPKSDR